MENHAQIPAALAEPRRWLALAHRHYENFPVGSWLLPKAARLHLHRIYAFARTADDLADELRDGEALASYRRAFLDHVDGGATTVPLFVDLRASIVACRLPVALFTDLLDAFAQDLVVADYDEAGLMAYCRKSADPVGRLVLRVCGHRDDGLDRLSDRICTALQLTNHLQDIGSDLRERGRIYFPREDLRRFGVERSMLLESHAGEPLRRLVLHWAERLVGDLRAGWPIVDAVRGRLRWELRAIVRGAAAVLGRIRACGGDVLGGRVRLNRREQLGCLLAGLFRAAPPRILERG